MKQTNSTLLRQTNLRGEYGRTWCFLFLFFLIWRSRPVTFLAFLRVQTSSTKLVYMYHNTKFFIIIKNHSLQEEKKNYNFPFHNPTTMLSFKLANFTVTFISAIVLLLTFQHVLATRPLDEVPSFNHNLILQSLPRGPVPPSAGNPCTNIPGRSQGRCMLTEMNAVGGGGAHLAPPGFPEFVVKFGAASAGSNGTGQK